MTPADIDSILVDLEAGTTLRVPLQTKLYPDTEALRTTLRKHEAAPGRFVLRTYFREFWAGHGWSVEQTEEETLTTDELRAQLTHTDRAQCSVDGG